MKIFCLVGNKTQSVDFKTHHVGCKTHRVDCNAHSVGRNAHHVGCKAHNVFCKTHRVHGNVTALCWLQCTWCQPQHTLLSAYKGQKIYSTYARQVPYIKYLIKMYQYLCVNS